MEPYRRTVLTFAVLVVLIVGLYFFTQWFSRTTGYVLGEDEKVALAQCLSNRNAVLFVSSGCYPCESQLEAFGDEARDHLSLIECETVEACPNVPGVPSWYIDGNYYPGSRELMELQELSGCTP